MLIYQILDILYTENYKKSYQKTYLRYQLQQWLIVLQ